MRKLLVTASAVAVAASLAACGSSSSSGSGDSGDGKTLTVYAASSLTETFGKLKSQFESSHPGVKVSIEYGGSSTLVQRIINGAPADVFASASPKNMDKLVSAGKNAGEPENFVSNTLEIAVPPDNPKKITGFSDLSKSGVTLVVCAAEVPCGSATEKLEKALGVTLKPKSEEPNVKSVLTKVEANEADAGLVYVTDVKSAGDKVKGIVFPEADKAVNKYPIVVTKDSKNADLAKEWIDLVTSSKGDAVFTEAGFKLL